MAATIIKNGRIHDAVHREAYVADILLADGKIAAIGGGLTAPADATVFDADGLEVYPGFVDAHTHIGLDGYGIGYEGCDYNEMNDIWTPQLRAIDGINPRDPSLADARRAGVTCVCTGPGSANVLGGTFLAMKTVGDRVDKMVVRDPVAMKCAFGENPKRCYRDKCDSTRMSTAAFLRGALMQARDYGARKQAANGDVTKMPAYNQKLEALLPVLDGTIPPQDQRKYMQVVYDETQRLTRLIRDLLDLSRIESGNVPMNPVDFNINELMRRVLIKYEGRIEEKNMEVEADFAGEPCTVHADVDRIEQVVSNLIDNAIKFCPDGGRLSLRVQSDGGKARVSVENTGPTIDKDELPLLFDRFHKADKSRSADREGWGLGLYIAKTIVGAHGGDIWATSENGVTQFNFTLPAVR